MAFVGEYFQGDFYIYGAVELVSNTARLVKDDLKCVESSEAAVLGAYDSFMIEAVKFLHANSNSSLSLGTSVSRLSNVLVFDSSRPRHPYSFKNSLSQERSTIPELIKRSVRASRLFNWSADDKLIKKPPTVLLKAMLSTLVSFPNYSRLVYFLQRETQEVPCSIKRLCNKYSGSELKF